MKRISFIFLICIFIIQTPILAEEKKFSHEVQVEIEERIPFYIRAGVGPKIGRLTLDLDALNLLLEESEVDFNPLNEEILIVGLESVIGRRNSDVFGLSKMHGENLSDSKSGAKAKLSLDYLGVIYQRILYLKKDFDLSLGATVGFGNSKIGLLHYLPSDSPESILIPTGTYLKEYFLFLEPRINLYKQLTSSIGVDLSVGYFLTYNIKGKSYLNGHSLDNILNNFRSPSINVRISFGI